jgi:hypothetical protein
MAFAPITLFFNRTLLKICLILDGVNSPVRFIKRKQLLFKNIAGNRDCDLWQASGKASALIA